jgi:hypothetical protein
MSVAFTDSALAEGQALLISTERGSGFTVSCEWLDLRGFLLRFFSMFFAFWGCRLSAFLDLYPKRQTIP